MGETNDRRRGNTSSAVVSRGISALRLSGDLFLYIFLVVCHLYNILQGRVDAREKLLEDLE